MLEEAVWISFQLRIRCSAPPELSLVLLPSYQPLPLVIARQRGNNYAGIKTKLEQWAYQDQA